MTLTLALLALACTPEQTVTPPHMPRLADVNYSADGYIDLLTRTEVLADAVDESPGGAAVDWEAATAFFMVGLNSQDMQALDDAIDDTDPDYANVAAGMGALLSVDTAFAESLGPMGNTMASLSNLTLKQWEDWFWSGSRSVTNDEGVTVSAQFNMAWVGTGWLLELLQSTEDGQYNETTWFSGYYDADGALGWWDFYRSGGVLAVMEFEGDIGDGYAEVYWATTDLAGDRMTWEWDAPGVGRIDFEDEQPPPNPADQTLVVVNSDGSGAATIPDDFDDTVNVCWDSDLLNVSCPSDKKP